MTLPSQYVKVEPESQAERLYAEIELTGETAPAGTSVVEKLDIILWSLKNIENTVNTCTGNPPRPPKPAVFSPKEKKPPVNETPPPRPPKIMDMKPSKKGKTLTKSQCDFLVGQLKNVIVFLDENFADEYANKKENVAMLKSVVKAMSV